jgi:hypothetical protein
MGAAQETFERTQNRSLNFMLGGRPRPETQPRHSRARGFLCKNFGCHYLVHATKGDIRRGGRAMNRRPDATDKHVGKRVRATKRSPEGTVTKKAADEFHFLRSSSALDRRLGLGMIALIVFGAVASLQIGYIVGCVVHAVALPALTTLRFRFFRPKPALN